MKKDIVKQSIIPQKDFYNRLPASFAQQRLWFLDQLSHNNAYTMLMSFPLDGDLQLAAFMQAFHEMISRHEILRTNLVLLEEQLVQVITPPFPSSLSLIDLHALPDALRQKEAQLLTHKEAQRTFDLARDTLFHAVLLRLAQNKHTLLLSVHHSIFDGWSIEILKRELLALYHAFRQGKPSPLPELPIQYADVAIWQQHLFQNKELERQLEYWKAHLAEAPSRIQLPTDHVRPLTKTFKGAAHSIILSQDLSKALKILSQQQRATLFMTLLATLKILLFMWTGQPDIVVGTVVTGRSRPETQGLLGCFINFVALRSQLSEELVGLDFLNQVKAAVINAYKYQDCPFEKVVEALQPARDANYNPLYNVAFLWQNYVQTSSASYAEGSVPFPSPTNDWQSSLLDLRFIGQETPEGLQITCEYDTDLFDVATIEQLNLSYRHLLEQLVHNHHQRLAAYTLSPGLVAQRARSQATTARFTLAIAATFTAEPLEEVLDFWIQQFGLPASLTFAPYNQVFQQLLDRESIFARNTQGVNVVLFRFEDWVRYDDHAVLTGLHEEARQKINEAVKTLIQSLSLATQRPHGSYLICLCPPSPALADDPSVHAFFQQLEASCAGALAALPNVSLITPSQILALYPVSSSYDPSMDQLGHVPFTPLFFTALGTTIFRTMCALRGFSAYKVLVLDCDNTLWKGICGEDGPQGIEIDVDSQSLQHLLVAQCRAGMLLCLCSRNNEQDVQEVFQRHKEMPLQWEHFVSWRINWQEKSDNLHSLAQELNIGLEQFIFLDDSPRECAEVQTRCPQVLTIQLPEQREARSHMLQHFWALDHLRVTHEDQHRTEFYRQERERRSFLQEGLSLERFLAELEVRVQITSMNSQQVERVAQLTQRTNQFNTTTIRRTEHELVRWCQEPGRDCLVVEVQDRFGSYGLVGAVLLQRSPTRIEIESLLLSCRVLGRGVEHRILAHIGTIAQAEGRMQIGIAYRPSTKNAPARAFLEQVVAEGKYPAEEGWPFVLSSADACMITVYDQEEETKQEREDISKEATLINEGAAPSSLLSLIATDLSTVEAIRQQIMMHQRKTRTLKQKVVVPRTPIEDLLAEIWCHVLNIDQVGSTDSFFALGGHSLLATQVIARLRSALQIDIPVEALFETPTLADFARTIETIKQENMGLQRSPLVALARRNTLPLSFAQERLWFLEQFEPGTSAYHIAVAYHLEGVLSLVQLSQSLQQLVQRHEVLRTHFVVTATGEPSQVIIATLTLPLPLIDLEGLSPAHQDITVSALASQEARTPFKLSQGPLLRLSVVRLSGQEHVLLLTMHHSISDGWSMSIVQQELTQFYLGALDDVPVLLPTLPIQYADYALWQRQWLQGEVLTRQINYWKQQLSELTPLDIPTDHPRPAQQTFRGASQSLVVSPEISQQLKALSRQEGVTLFMMLLAAFQVLLARYCGQQDIVVGSPIANRTQIETEGLIGFFVNTLVLRSTVSGTLSFRDLLAQVRRVCLEAYVHQDLPFEKLVAELRPPRDLSHHPLFQVFFALQNTDLSATQLMGLTMRSLHIDSKVAKFDVSLSLMEGNQGLLGVIEYNRDLFEPATIDRMIIHFQRLLAHLTAHPERPLWQHDLLTEEERHQLLTDWNATQVHYEQERCIHELFEEQVERCPEVIALVTEEGQMTYRALNQRANHLAHHLRALGVRPEVCVGLCIQRSLDLVIGLLAVLKAGGAYVPLDPGMPRERLAFLLADAQPDVLLTQQGLLELAPSQVAHVLDLDTLWECLVHYPHDNLSQTVVPDHLAYVIYTSGSTGTPKGVLISHRALTNFLFSMHQNPGITTQDTLLAITAPSFDIAGLELYLPLIAGARLVIASSTIATNALALADELARTQTTMMQATPATWRMLHSIDWQAASSLKILCGGEALSLELAHQLMAHDASLYNMYGPTETTIWSTLHQIKTTDTSISIGRPIANTTIYILDQYLQLLPVGVRGELYIGGSGLARGYLNRPDLTSERFICHPFSSHPTDRLYRTGDFARYRPDGTIELIGRVDHQIKLRGYRIELGEIEALLSQHPGVGQSVVLLRQDIPHDARLVAYIVPNHAQTVNPKELRQYLQQRVPDYMVPMAFMLLEALPLTPNGKLDRRALPTPEPTRALLDKQFVAPQTAIEEALAGLWVQVLHVDRVGIYDNFFALGGHSLLATQVLSYIRRVFHVEISLRTLFIAPTIAQLAAYITTERSNDQQSSTLHLTPVEQGPVTGSLPFTIGQRWVLKEMRASPPRYQKMSQVFAPQGPVRPALLELALQYILRHHDMLRLRLIREHEEWHQFIIAPDQEPTPFLWVDFSRLSEEEQEKAAHLTALQRRTDLHKMQGWLLRLTYFDFGPQKAGNILFNFNHIITDYVSNEIVYQDFLSVYQQLSQGERVSLPPKTASFKQWAECIIAYLHSEELKQEMEHLWLKRPWEKITPLPLDYPEGKRFDTFATNRTIRTLLSSEETDLLYQCLNSDTQILDVLLTALTRAFYCWTNSPFLYVQVQYHGRELVFDNLDLSRTVGYISFGKMMVFDISRADTAESTLHHVQEQLRLFSHQAIGLDMLLQLGDEHVQKKVQKIPKHEVLFDYRSTRSINSSEAPLAFPVDKYQATLPDEQDYRGAVFDVRGGTVGGCLYIDWEYGGKLHNKSTVEQLGSFYMEALRELIVALSTLDAEA